MFATEAGKAPEKQDPKKFLEVPAKPEETQMVKDFEKLLKDDPKVAAQYEEWSKNEEAGWDSPAAAQYSILNRDDTQFLVSKRLIGPFGTLSKPTMVYSPKPYRIVGCTGPHEQQHALVWFAMEGYLKHGCPHCGQIFQLTNNPDECNFDYTPKHPMPDATEGH